MRRRLFLTLARILKLFSWLLHFIADRHATLKAWRFARLIAYCEKKRHHLTPIRVENKWGAGCVTCKYFRQLDRQEFRRLFNCSPEKFAQAFRAQTGEDITHIKKAE